MAFNLQNFVKQQLTNALKRGGSPSNINNNAKQNPAQFTPARANPLSNYITDLMKVISEGNSKYQSPRKQYLSLLYNVIKYIMMNPSSSKELENLYQTFKNFISKRKILVPSQKCDFVGDIFIIKDERKDIKIKVRNIINWLNDNFYLEIIGKSVRSKIYHCCVKKMELIKAKISFNEFDTLVSENTVEDFVFFISAILDSCHQYVQIDKILQKLPNVTLFTYITAAEKYSLATLKHLNAIKICRKFNFLQLRLCEVDETFNPALFCHFINQNSGPLTEVSIWFKNNSEEVKNALESALEDMKQLWSGKNLTLIF